MVRKSLIILPLLGLILVLAGAGAWLMRGSIVQHYLSQACNERGFICEVERADVSLSNLTLNGLSVTDKENMPVASGRLSADLAWPSLVRPQVMALRIDDSPHLSLSYDGTGFSLGSVPVSSLMTGQGDSDAPVPKLMIEDTALKLETPAGTLSGTLSASGTFPNEGVLLAALNPTDLAQNGFRIALNKGEAALQLTSDAITGNVTLDISEASLPGQTLQNAIITLNIDDQTQPKVNWSIKADRIEDSRVGTFSDVDAAGMARFSERPEHLNASVLETMERLTLQAKTGPSEAINRRAESLSANLTLSKDAPSAPIRLDAEADFTAGTGPFGTAERGTLTVSGDLDEGFETYDLSGRIVATNVAASPRAKARTVSYIPTAAPLEAHGQQLRTALSRALDSFSASTDFDLIKIRSEPLLLGLSGPVALKANSGANLLLTPIGAQPILLSNSNETQLSGLLSAKGGGFPETTILLRELKSAGESFHLKTGGVNIKDWRARDVTLAMNLTDFSLDQNPGAPLRLSSNGRLMLDGPLFGVTFSNGEVFGALNAVRSGRNWRVETQNQSCMGFDYSSLQLSPTVSFGGAALRLCPPQGRLLSTSKGGLSGAFGLGDITVPVFGDRFSGEFGLTNTRLDWQADSALSMQIAADALALPLSIDGRSLRIDTAASDLRLDLNQTLAVRAALASTKLSGDLVPANIDIRDTRLTGAFTTAGFQGTAETKDVRISDFRDDPLYQPILGDLTAQFSGADMRVTGPFRLAVTNDLIGFSNADINLLTLTGTARVETPILTFTPRGLKPRQISERLRGIFPDARGTTQGEADFRVNRGKLSGTGRINLSDF
ncbi:MAG: hypothetical protein AAFR74_05175, partial [Pseudomonadota bacterium]